jgi:hypothetical protein
MDNIQAYRMSTIPDRTGQIWVYHHGEQSRDCVFVIAGTDQETNTHKMVVLYDVYMEFSQAEIAGYINLYENQQHPIEIWKWYERLL